MKGTTRGFPWPAQLMNKVHAMETRLGWIAGVIFILLCIVCWFWIGPAPFPPHNGDNPAELIDRRAS